MKQNKITFTNDDGVELAAILNLPEDEKPLAFAVFAHCFTCTKNIIAAANIARALSRQRIGVLRFDFTGLGESEGDFTDSTFSQNLKDLVAAARYLEENYQAPKILVGHSLGGTAVLQAANQIDSTTAVVTLAAPYHPRHAIKYFDTARDEIEKKGKVEVNIAGREFTINKEFLDDLENQEPKEKIAKLNAALLVMHSPRDNVVAIDNATAIYQAAKHPKSFVSLDPADHLLSDKNDSLYAADLMATWARRYLGTGEKGAKLPEVLDNRVTVRTGQKGFRTDIFASGHPLVADEPEKYGGEGLGPSPYDYLQVALGACTSMTVQMYARRKKWPLESAVVRLVHEKIHAEDCDHCEEKTGKIDYFERELELQGDLSEEQKQRLLEIAEKCPVHKTLHSEVDIKTKLRGEKEDQK